MSHVIFQHVLFALPLKRGKTQSVSASLQLWSLSFSVYFSLCPPACLLHIWKIHFQGEFNTGRFPPVDSHPSLLALDNLVYSCLWNGHLAASVCRMDPHPTAWFPLTLLDASGCRHALALKNSSWFCGQAPGSHTVGLCPEPFRHIHGWERPRPCSVRSVTHAAHAEATQANGVQFMRTGCRVPT